jgi:hypothetical protein
MSNPYSTKPDYAFWSRAVTSAGPGMLDPMVGNFPITPDKKIATMGSCFAQHLARHISRIGLNYYVEETPPEGMNEQEARAKNYGVFSGRYGNIYTARQALQLLRRSLGSFVPGEFAWPYKDGYVDAFRPQIQPEPLPSVEVVKAEADEHLRRVRTMFESTDWLVFTLGLTEAWRSKLDGAVYPSAPGVHGGTFDPERHEFINFSVQEVMDDLRCFINELRAVNPRVKIIFTVSPVPLIATYEDRHVLVSTVCSKAILRCSADAMEREFEDVHYFPAYEIITTPVTGSYYLDDLREVSPLGVKHVMRVFSRHFVAANFGDAAAKRSEPLDLRLAGDPDIVCDEEEIERALVEGGFHRAK